MVNVIKLRKGLDIKLRGTAELRMLLFREGMISLFVLMIIRE